MTNSGFTARLWRFPSVSLALLVGVALCLGLATTSEARGRHHGRHAHDHRRSITIYVSHHHHRGARQAYQRRHGRHHFARAESSGGEMTSPRGVAAIVVDGNSGRTLFAANENQPRHPASVTKVMTLYLLFEQLEKGHLRLDSPLMISQHAAAQAPSKLGLQPGETIEVEHAIKAVVTKSANDIAVAIAENVGGDEDSFARMMTSKAHALGMNSTHFANASGLPNSEQITTAHDLAVLGRAIQDRFPHYYRYFSTHTFAYRGAVMQNHNHLLGRVEGMDGIKTGYTAASGFNLLTSVRRGGHHIVAVVLGGASAGARDRYMASLIEDHIDDGAGVRTAAAITEDQSAERSAAVEPAPAPVAEREVENTAAASEDEAEQPAPRARKQAAAAPAPGEEKARPAFVSGGKKQAENAPPGDRKPRRGERVRVAAVDGSTTVAGGKAVRHEGVATTTPSALKHNDSEGAQLAKFDGGRPAHTGWMIQLGATDDAGKATELLTRARSAGHAVPPGAKAFTEKVKKGNETLYRARFAGLEEQSAESACKTLKRSGFSCFATKN